VPGGIRSNTGEPGYGSIERVAPPLSAKGCSSTGTDCTSPVATSASHTCDDTLQPPDVTAPEHRAALGAAASWARIEPTIVSWD
jgi:hypothetical protein